MGVSPLLTSTISDRFKIRRILYIVFTMIFALASLGGGFTKSAPTLIVARVFQAVGSSGASVLGAGSVADIYVICLLPPPPPPYSFAYCAFLCRLRN